MIKPRKVRKIGNSLGVTLPKAMLDSLGLSEGDQLIPVRTSNGIELTRYDPDFERTLESGRDFMRRYPKAMKTLAEG